MPETDQKTPDLAAPESMSIISKFIELEKHAEKCAFFHDAANFPVLSQIYRAIHFPKP